MSDTQDPVDFEILEGQKENIQSLPGGRSARKLAQLYSPNPLKPLSTPNPADTQDAHSAKRAEFEQEVAAIDESDDPLDVYDRYVRWTLEAYPSAQATPQSQLDQLLERATKSFVSSAQYRNDPRYLKMWVYYIQFFSDAPRETFLFLSRHGIGESLALFYEEYATWLEGQGRWAQAEEVYKLGIECEARPQARLLRKFKEFEHRMSEQPAESVRPTSPAIPPVRAALATKVDPFAIAMLPDDPQAPRPSAGLPGYASPKANKTKGKMAIFSDSSAKEPAMSERATAGSRGWDSIGSLSERKKENVIEPKPWAGETLKAGGKKPSGPKMAIFKDTSQKSKIHSSQPPQTVFDQLSQYKISSASDQVVVNPRTGKMERILVDLEVIYPQPDVRGAELSFEEVWARNRGWLDRSWEEEEGEEGEMAMVDVGESVSHYDESFILQQQQQRRRQHEEEQRQQQEQEQQKKSVQRQKKLEMYHDDTSISRDENSPIQGTSRLEHQSMAIRRDSPEARSYKMQIHRDGVVPQKQKLSIHRDDEPVVPKKQKMAIHHDEFVDEENRLASSLSPPVARPPVQKIPIHRDEPVDENGMVIQQQQKPVKSKKKVMDYNETQIIKAKLDSPSRPKISKRKSIAADPTMTIHTKSATDDIYDIFNAPLPSKTGDKGGSDDDEEYDSDEYESDGESMGTTRNVDLEDSDDDDAKSDWSDYTIKKKASGLDDLTCKTNPDFTVRGVIDDEEEEEEEEDDDDDDDESDGEEEEETEAEEQSEISEMRGSDEGNQSSQFSEQEPSLQSVENGLVAQIGQQAQQQQSHTITHTKFIPVPPEDYVPPTRPYRDPAEVANNRLPFMTPITERTEMSLDFQQTQGKTPSRSRGTMHSMPEEDEDEDEEEVYNSITDLNEAMSSPLIDTGKSPISYNTKIAQPAFPKSTTKALAPKGPIIKDLQINPMDEGIRSQILNKTRPPLVTYVGFFDHRDQNYEKGNEIRRFARAMSKAKSSGDHLAGPVIRLPDSQGMYTVKKELGAGAFAPVYLVENSAPYSSQADEAIVLLGPKAPLSRHRNHLEALKMETPPSLWEFFMMRLTHNRLGPQDRAAASLSYAHELHLYRDEGFLVLPYHPHGTLLDVVNHFRAEPSGVMDEQLAMFFSIELLRTVEALHSKAILHGDLKPDNCLLRIDAASSASRPASALTPFGSVGSPEPETTVLTPQYHVDGSGGWATRGVTLIDFGRGIDMRAFVADQVQFIADWKTTSQDCAEMREGRSWTWHIDYHGLAGIIHTLLFGKYIETVRMDQGPGTTGGISGTAVGGPLNIGIGSRKYRIRESLKRYWQTDIWAECFDLLLNPGHFVERDGEGGRMPVTRGLRRVRESMEEWLSANCERGAGLKTLVNKVEAFAKGRR